MEQHRTGRLWCCCWCCVCVCVRYLDAPVDGLLELQWHVATLTSSETTFSKTRGKRHGRGIGTDTAPPYPPPPPAYRDEARIVDDLGDNLRLVGIKESLIEVGAVHNQVVVTQRTERQLRHLAQLGTLRTCGVVVPGECVRVCASE
jgi:hypothetical protein